MRNGICRYFYLAVRNRFPVFEGSAACGMLGDAASRKIRAPVVNHLFPRLCVNNLVQSRAINKIAREISSTALLVLVIVIVVVVVKVPTNGKKGHSNLSDNKYHLSRSDKGSKERNMVADLTVTDQQSRPRRLDDGKMI